MSSACENNNVGIPEEIEKSIQFGFINSRKPSWLKSTNDLREWQKECVKKFHEKFWSDSNNDDPLKNRFVINAVPASGKTIAALMLSYLALKRNLVSRVIIITPGSVIRDTWGETAAEYGIEIKNKPTREIMKPLIQGFHGRATTYQQIASMKPHQVAWLRHEIETVPTLLICDEIHHASLENSWGVRLMDIFEEHIKGVVLLSGTPFRTDGRYLPFLGNNYDLKDVTDVTYDYMQGMRDGCLRKIRYVTQDGIFNWNQGNSSYSYVDMENGERVSRYTKVTDNFKHIYLKSSVPKHLKRQRYNFAICTDPECNTISTKLICQGMKQLLTLRRKFKLAQGLIVVESTEAAHFAQEIFRNEKMKQISTRGWRSVIAISANGGAEKIKEFRNRPQDHEFIIAIRQVSEGVDIPNLAVCVYLSNITTLMFIIQVLGRILRMSKWPGMEKLTECWFLSPKEDIIDKYIGSMAANVCDLASELIKTEEEKKDEDQDSNDGNGDGNGDAGSDVSDSEIKDETIEPITNIASAANQSTIRHIEDSFQTEKDPEVWRTACSCAELTNGSAEEWYEQIISNRGVPTTPTPIIAQPTVQPSLQARCLALRKEISKTVNRLHNTAKRYGASEWSRGRIWGKLKGKKKLMDFTEEELIHMREEKIPRISTQIKRSRPRPRANITPWVKKAKNE